MLYQQILSVIPTQCLLGEGAYYSAVRQQAIWVDIYGKRVFTLTFPDMLLEQFETSEPVCWVKDTADGGLIAGFEKGIYRVDEQMRATETVWLLPDDDYIDRLNDAKTDRQGNLYFGTMDADEKRNTGNLYRLIGQDNAFRLDEGYVVSNGPAFSHHGDQLFSVASAERCIYRFAKDQQGEFAKREMHIRFDDTQGYPDGVTVDSENCLWVAAWDGGAIFRYSAAGQLLATLHLPVPRVTSMVFLGQEMNALLVTTARRGLDKDMLERHPQSGDTFIISVGITGIPEHPVVL